MRPITDTVNSSTRKSVVFPTLLGSVLILLMMVVGLIMLLNQGKLITISDGFFYKIMTLHGTGMIGAGALAGTAIMYYFTSQYIKLSKAIFVSNIVLSILGVVMVLIGIFVFDFAAAWTFLYPLPAISGGMWGAAGAVFYLGGMTVLGTGFLLFYLDTGRAIIKKYGNLGNALGWPIIFGKTMKEELPPAIVAGTMVTIVNTAALVSGASVLIMSIINIFNPSFTMDPLLSKNLIYAFGHIFANSIIYMGVIAVYEIFPKYTGRPWKVYGNFLIAWNASTLFTMIIYPHHLLMDFAVPKWMLILGQVLSYANGLPVLVVTAFGALQIIFRSGIKWDMPSTLFFMSMFGWVMGVVPAIIDATIAINHVMHNTKWVPGHFHMYMGIGAVAMIFGFMYYVLKVEGLKMSSYLDKLSFWVYLLFFAGLTFSFLYSGKLSAPRRWSQHFPEWVPADQLGAVAAIGIIFATSVFIIRFAVSAKQIGTQKDEKETKEKLYA
ncbi:cbb3-type cytochrome c oxidase subunit I [Schinkia azotoformans]|uniref:Cytochrome c oxidase, subunit I n=1 Tax=Schinkia azotoformans LMG 9581 TaxID=1131731 RepID=K6DJL3_SCHAZ|nr:cbb3-type cytochrome c oxidase subunit I [Schinkia azotoformans]EKN68313.1 cytochrome c oxidase, subunit I [Schinkia azotoformans LMG 9581]MEC1638573.1 cbb3-type cytochrome c oxidase subunit I [Schinkia azotoformans]MEC1945992.1 cbb3-type cytochrome c oxidase subunit I [Schinkia azotoformans]